MYRMNHMDDENENTDDDEISNDFYSWIFLIKKKTNS